MSQYSVIVKNISVGTEATSSDVTLEFSEAHHKYVNERILVTESAWKGWLIAFPPGEEWFHESWLRDWLEI